MHRLARNTLLGIGALTLAAVTGLAAQSAAPQVDPTLAELRAMRADINERLEANIRVQLLLGRLTLQEQRTNTVVRQLTEVTERLRTNEQTKGQVEGFTKMFGLDAVKPEDEDNFLTATLRGQIEHAAKAEAELKQQQTELTTALAQEQARWAAFNTKLEELERLFERKK
jgi:hypothetical protein